ncbi:MAG TPA: phenylacetic acid degradation protein PaaY [Burkholderiales bacterium]|nr:phenylacetic acid degradation protein PaaY [Burkholderiales bacterium]
MPKVYAIDGIVPVVEPGAFVHPSAVLIGDVIVGARAYIGPCASLRGDFGRIIVEAGANLQDSCTMHGFPGKDTVAGAESTIGHGALVGMNCVINDNAEIGEDAMIAALSFVKAEARIPPRSLAAGIPARVLRELREEELRWKNDNLQGYQQLAVRSMTRMELVEALTQPEAGRKRFDFPYAVPHSDMKRKHG